MSITPPPAHAAEKRYPSPDHTIKNKRQKMDPDFRRDERYMGEYSSHPTHPLTPMKIGAHHPNIQNTVKRNMAGCIRGNGRGGCLRKEDFYGKINASNMRKNLWKIQR